MTSIGIIPAAGKATRFGGVLKELLPVPGGGTALGRAAESLPVDQVVVVTNHAKILDHSRMVPGAIFVIQEDTSQDIWGAMLAGMRIDADEYYFVMPDTVFPIDGVFQLRHDFMMGIFATDTPERFGCIVDGRVINKSREVRKPATAWGVLSWSSAVKYYWYTAFVETYTDAINKAMMKFGYDEYELDYYYDLASFGDYKEFLHAEI